MVQRKDSLCFVEFVRGKYNLQNRGYLMHLFRNMTGDERERVAQGDFDALWNGFWQQDNRRLFVKEYDSAKTRFCLLKEGFYLRPASPTGGGDGGGEGGAVPPLIFMDLNTLLNATLDHRAEPEFGFPKGRRNLNESDLDCAMREFKEESGVALANVHVFRHVQPFEEVFTGCNHVRYRHVYFLAQLCPPPHGPGGGGEADPLYSERGGVAREVQDPLQRREVRAVGWFDEAGVYARLGPENTERHALFRRVSAWVMQHRPQLSGNAATCPSSS